MPLAVKSFVQESWRSAKNFPQRCKITEGKFWLQSEAGYNEICWSEGQTRWTDKGFHQAFLLNHFPHRMSAIR
ncbi:MAG: hypothetical protein DDG59_03245 [Anaerolineae bacterium]|nr:MAG: hypothetical protein DDG59_03245 [Anaerolineae bacterium]